MKEQTEASKLQMLNRLVGQLTGSDPRTIAHVQSAINFTLEDADEEGPGEASLLDAVEDLVRLYNQPGTTLDFAHCDLRKDEYDPLWVRGKLLESLASLTSRPDAIVLVTGLRRMICPPGKNWTARRQESYEQARHYLEDLTLTEASRGRRLHMLFL